MALRDFSAGFPRNGQWVLVSGQWDAAAEGEAGGEKRKLCVLANASQRLGIFCAETLTTVKRESGVVVATTRKKLFADPARPMGKHTGRVEFVDEFGGYAEAAQIEFERMTPLTDRNLIPARRLEKMDPGFVPVP